MTAITKEIVLSTLKEVIDPKTGKDIVTAGLISGISIADGADVSFIITINADDHPVRHALKGFAEKALESLSNVRHARAILTAEHQGEASNQQIDNRPERRQAHWNFSKVPGVKKIIMVASGKGGVGKSTTAVNLAHAANAKGIKVGLLDADISGASLPMMMGLLDADKPDFKNNLIQPILRDGIKCMSMGFLIGDDAAIMRGAMISKALNQLLRGCEWGDLDILFIDMPPGTGDVYLSLLQQVPVSYGGGGAILVTTPQDIAMQDAAKTGILFEKTYIPIIGVIENMSYFEDENSQNKSYIFGKGGGEKLAQKFNTDLLAEIPILPKLAKAMDEGEIGQEIDYYMEVVEKLS